ncbi:MAG: hypothetical protein KAR11_08970 [Phycisphaerae bacterium]|nr:hypothetical protein [Phycisphaerae bacterium]
MDYFKRLKRESGFLSGMASCMDLGSTHFSHHLDVNLTGQIKKDMFAIKQDWDMVASDLRQAIGKCREKENG